MSPKERKRAIELAHRKVERAMGYLSDATTLLASAGFEQPARTMQTASYEAATAIYQADADLAKEAP